MNFIKFTSEKLSADILANIISTPCCETISLYIGKIESNFDDNLVFFEYNTYDTVGINALERICNEVREDLKSVNNIAIYQRIGKIPTSEFNIIIAVSSSKREEAFKATAYCADSVKKLMPLWKKKSYAREESHEMEMKQSLQQNPKMKGTFEIEQKVEVPFVPPYLIQIKATNQEVNERINNYMKRKRSEVDESNIREFCCGDRNSEFICARVDAVLQKRKDSNSHLQVNRVLNSYQYRDQTNSNYLKKFIPSNGIEERLQNLECQLSLTTVTPKNIYNRLKLLEDRLLYLESISPEYIQFWDKSLPPSKSVKKKIFSLDEIDDLITETERQIKGV